MPAADPPRLTLRDHLRETFTPEGSALDLAVVRISVVVVLMLSASIASADRWAALPEAARTLPEGVRWLVPHLPIDTASVQIVRAVFRVAGVLAGVGLFTQASCAVLALTTFYLLLVPQLGGAVFHDHHLLWLTALLAASPCGDALSIDAWLDRRAGRARPTGGRAHGAAVRAAWCVIGLVYFFPGVHKLATSGLDWALSDNLRNQMWLKWAQDPSLLPSSRIDRWPLLCRALAALTIAFELSFLPLVLAGPRTRTLAVLGALGFHAGAEAFMGIQFSVLWGCYGMFVPWSALLARWRPGPVRVLSPTRSLLPLAIVALPLLSAIAIAGALGRMQAYPFACYPTFEWIARDHMPALLVELEHPDGRREWLDRSVYQEAGPRGWALSWRLAGAYGSFDREALSAWWADACAREPLRSASAEAAVAHFYRGEIAADPDRHGEVISRRPLTSLDLR